MCVEAHPVFPTVGQYKSSRFRPPNVSQGPDALVKTQVARQDAGKKYQDDRLANVQTSCLRSIQRVSRP
jgi:hypothetical protein